MKVWNVIKSVIVWLIVALAACMMIFTIVSVATFDRADRNLFGFKAFIVLSDSMKKTDFNVCIRQLLLTVNRPSDFSIREQLIELCALVCV